MDSVVKKIKIASVVLFIISVAVFDLYIVYDKYTKDTVAPEIYFEGDLLQLGAASGEEEILANVSASDDQSGDVTDTLVVEELANLGEGDTRVITYAAIDEAGNVGRRKRVLQYTDYEVPQFVLHEPLRYPSGRGINILERVGANSVLDGDLSSDVNYSLYNVIDLINPGFYTIEFSVTDSAGVTQYLQTELEVYDRLEEYIQVELSEYLVYLRLGSGFRPREYYVGASEEGELSIQSNVNTREPGVYSVDYTVKTAHEMGKSRLIVVVME